MNTRNGVVHLRRGQIKIKIKSAVAIAGNRSRFPCFVISFTKVLTKRNHDRIASVDSIERLMHFSLSPFADARLPLKHLLPSHFAFEMCRSRRSQTKMRSHFIQRLCGTAASASSAPNGAAHILINLANAFHFSISFPFWSFIAPLQIIIPTNSCTLCHKFITNGACVSFERRLKRCQIINGNFDRCTSPLCLRRSPTIQRR